jgi:hypothetical protein
LNSRPGSKALSTLESMLAGVIAGASILVSVYVTIADSTSNTYTGSKTTIVSNPIWVVQTSQAVRAAEPSSSESFQGSHQSVLQTIQAILAKDGLKGFFRGLGPALVLVINPVLQYTVFEQLKNFLIKRRTAKMRAGGAGGAVAVLSDWDFFFLGALSKLGALLRYGSSFYCPNNATQLQQVLRILTCESQLLLELCGPRSDLLSVSSRVDSKLGKSTQSNTDPLSMVSLRS